MQGNPVGWFEIYVDDMARAKKFYKSVLEAEFEAWKNMVLPVLWLK